MAVAVLSPWPKTPAALAAARAALNAALPNTPGPYLTDDEADRLGSVASAMVERYAPTAPQAVRNEAVIRACAYMHETVAHYNTKDHAVGPVNVTYFTNNHAAMFRNCGAAALLSPWKIRRAGMIG